MSKEFFSSWFLIHSNSDTVEMRMLIDRILVSLIRIFLSCRPDKLNKLTTIPGWVKIKIEGITELPESRNFFNSLFNQF